MRFYNNNCNKEKNNLCDKVDNFKNSLVAVDNFLNSIYKTKTTVDFGKMLRELFK